MHLAIADPPYPPIFAERRDLADGGTRLTIRSRATRWYGDGTRAQTDSPPADFHADASVWDSPAAHRQLLEMLVEGYDGFAIATSPDGLGAYHPLPVSARVMSWHKTRAMPGGQRLISAWEPVIVLIPEGRRARDDDREPIRDVLTAAAPQSGFAGAKPPEWTRWVLDALGYDPQADTLHDLFPGSGAVTRAADGLMF